MTRSTASTARRRAPTRSRGPATSTPGSGGSASCSTRSSPRTGGPLNHARRAALARVPAAQVEAFLASESETETGFRPRPDLLEVAFGHFDEPRRPRSARPLRLGDVALRGRIDRIDVDETGRAVVRDYKTGKNVTLGGQVHRGRQAADPALHAGRRAHPGPGRRRRASTTRSARSASASRAASSPARTRTSRGSGSSAPTGSSTMTSSSRSTRPRRSRATPPPRCGPVRSAATRSAGECPKYCNFQAICRLERAIGVDENGNGG